MRTSFRPPHPGPLPAAAWTVAARLAIALAALAGTGCAALMPGHPAAGGAAAPHAIGIYYAPGFAQFPMVPTGESADTPALSPGRLGGETRRHLTRLLEGQALPVASTRAPPRPGPGGGTPATVVEPRIEWLAIREPARWRGFSGRGVHRAEIRYRVTVHRPEGAELVELTGRAERWFEETLLASSRHQRDRLARLAVHDALGQLVDYLRRTGTEIGDAQTPMPAPTPAQARTRPRSPGRAPEPGRRIGAFAEAAT